MAEVSYCIYSFTGDNKIYIGITKNWQLRLWQHNYKSCNPGLRKLLRDGKTIVKTAILYDNLTQEKAVALEKELIKQYRNDPNYELLNIQSGGLRGSNKIVSEPKISKSTKLSDDDVKRMRLKFSRRKYTINAEVESRKYNLTKKYFLAILKGSARQRASGPLLGKDYNNG